MSESPVILLGMEKEEWCVVLHRKGKIVPMTPKYFPVCGSLDEVRERGAIFKKVNPTWAKKWKNWHLAGMRVDGQLTL